MTAADEVAAGVPAYRDIVDVPPLADRPPEVARAEDTAGLSQKTNVEWAQWSDEESTRRRRILRSVSPALCLAVQD